MEFNFSKSKMLYLATSVALIMTIIVSMFAPMLLGATNEVSYASTDYWQKNDNFNISFLSNDRQIVEGNAHSSAKFGLSGEYSKYQDYDTSSFTTEAEFKQVVATVDVQWYTNTTMSYEGATAFGDEQNIEITYVKNAINSDLAIEDLDIGTHYVYAVVSDGTFSVNTYIRKIEVIADDGTPTETNNITVEYKTYNGTYMTYSTRVGEKFSIPSAPVMENYTFVGWALKDNTIINDKTVITDAMVGANVSNTNTSYIGLTAVFDSLENGKQFKVTYKQYNGGWWIFKPDTELSVKTVFDNDVLPDISSTLSDNFSYYSFDKKGVEVVPENYEVTSDLVIYCNFKDDVNVKTYRVKIMKYEDDRISYKNYEDKIFNEDDIIDLSDVEVLPVKTLADTYYFQYWSYDLAGSFKVKDTDTIDKDMTIYAQYTTDEKLAVDSTTLNKVQKDGFFTKGTDFFKKLYVDGGCSDTIAYVLGLVSFLVVLAISVYLVVKIIFVLIGKIK